VQEYAVFETLHDVILFTPPPPKKNHKVQHFLLFHHYFLISFNTYRNDEQEMWKTSEYVLKINWSYIKSYTFSLIKRQLYSVSDQMLYQLENTSVMICIWTTLLEMGVEFSIISLWCLLGYSFPLSPINLLVFSSCI